MSNEVYLEQFDLDQVLGRVITRAVFENDALGLQFSDGSALTLRDAGQCCCESRYATCDDDVTSLVGSCLVSITIKAEREIPIEPDDDGYVSSGEHDALFLEVQTTGGFITMVTHNEHNGYYGGFTPKVDFRLKHVTTPDERKFKRLLLSSAVFQDKYLP